VEKFACFLCGGAEGHLTAVHGKGRSTLIALAPDNNLLSQLRSDEKCFVHEKCRRKYRRQIAVGIVLGGRIADLAS
jgi:hypothetical protein